MSLNLEVAPLWSYSLLLLSLYTCFKLTKQWGSQSKAPIVGVRSRVEIRLISNFRFFKDAEVILLDGYTKVGTLTQTQTLRLILA